MYEIGEPQYARFDEAKARGWYQKWRQKVHNWVKRHSGSEIADILLFLPDLFILCVGLVLDSRVPAKLKVALVSAIGYVLSPFDIMPEAVLGVAGLIDDAGILIIALHTFFGVVEMEPADFDEVLRDYWHGSENPVDVVRALYTLIFMNANKLFGKLWAAIRRFWAHQKRNRSQPYSEAVIIT